MQSTSRRVQACEYFGLTNREITSVLGINEQELSELQEDRAIVLRQIEKTRSVEEIQKSINEWLEEPEMIEARKEYLIAAAREAVKDPENPIYEKLKYRLRAALGEAITPEQIQAAREYPIERLIKFTQRKARCIWHNEKTPSMHLFPTNKVYCFGCEKGGDAVDVYQVINRATFSEAVQALS